MPSRNDVYPYGTVIQLTEEAVQTMFLPENKDMARARRLMILTPGGSAMPLIIDYDDADTHFPRLDLWEPVDE